MSGRVKVGVVGAGSLGYHHVRLLRDLLGGDFAGFHDRSAERAKKVAGELAVRAFDDLDSLIDAVDALSIVTSTPAHHAMAKAAIARGKHVFIEKPITVTLAEADDLLALATTQGVTIQVGHVERFNRAMRAALPYVEAPRFIVSDRLAPFSPRGSDVAVVLDLMIHDIDLVLTLTGSDVANVEAIGAHVITPMVDIANARLTFASGAVANITASRVSRSRSRKLRIFQPNGSIALDLAAGNGEFFRMRDGLDLAAMSKGPVPMDAFAERIPLEAPEGEPLKLEFEAWLLSLRGQGPLLVSGHAGRQALDVALRVMREIERTMPPVTTPVVPRA